MHLGRLPPGRRGLKQDVEGNEREGLRSPSPRKAWIETSAPRSVMSRCASPSPRKAWIETASSGGEICQARVAFPPEGVD